MSAQGRTLARLALFALSAVPLVVKAPYLWRAWAHSPLDRAHLNLYGALALVAICAAIAVLRRRRLARLRLLPRDDGPLTFDAAHFFKKPSCVPAEDMINFFFK